MAVISRDFPNLLGGYLFLQKKLAYGESVAENIPEAMLNKRLAHVKYGDILQYNDL